MGKTLEVAADRAFDQTKTVLPAEVARGVYMRNPPRLQALKLMHLMIATAAGRMADEVQHQIRLSDIRKIDGMKNHDRQSLIPLFEDLAAAVLTYDDPEKKTVTIGGLMDETRIDYRDEVSGDLMVTWWFGRTFRRMAAESNHWAILDRQTVFHLGSKYSVLLFQHISSLVNLDRMVSKTFSISELRAVLGVPEGKLDRFANLKAWALSPAIEEINQLSRITLTATPNKVGRTVASVTIAWQLKDDASDVKRELQNHSAGRIARRSVSQGDTVVGFPSTGGITYSPYWIELKRSTGCNKDNELIASDFRRFCRDKGISLSAHNIEKVFVSFCQKVGKV